MSRRPLSVRLAATRVITAIISDGRSLNSVLAEWSAQTLATDRALLQELCYGTTRWFFRLDAVLTALLRKPLKAKDNDLRCLMLLGLYQLEQTRVPPHAAVAETVAVVAALGKGWARGLVNAVLRNFQRQRESVLAALDNDLPAALAHPSWLVEQLQQAWPQHWQSILEANNQRPPLVLRVNLQRQSRVDYLQQLQEANIQAEPLPDSSCGLLLPKAVDVTALPGFEQGALSIQDGAAQLAAPLLDAQPGERILDACAAPGGKTAHILERTPELMELVALDVDKERLQLVNETLQRLHLSATTSVGDAAQPERWWDGLPFDRILLDAPCSCSGVIRRRPDIKLLRRPEDIEQLVALQRTILNALWPLLKPGGRLLYATCSVLPQENARQIEAFIAAQADAAWLDPEKRGRQILPGEAGMDGFYLALVEKR